MNIEQYVKHALKLDDLTNEISSMNENITEKHATSAVNLEQLLCIVNPHEKTVPLGYVIIPDSVEIKSGDIVLDYKIAQGFAMITESSVYSELIGKTGIFARLHHLVYEVFTKRE